MPDKLNIKLLTLLDQNCDHGWIKSYNCLVFEPQDAIVHGSDNSLRILLTLNASDSTAMVKNALTFQIGITDDYHLRDTRSNVEIMPGYSYDIGLNSLTTVDKSGKHGCIPTGNSKYIFRY